jgi:predicted dehydrogenase
MRIGIIGGGFGYKVVRSAVLRSESECTLIGGYYGRSKKCYELGVDNNREKFYADVNDLMKDPNIDTVVIAAPPTVQLDLIGKISSSKKNIICEKPGGISLYETIKIIKICEQNKVELFFGMQYRFENGINEIKEISKKHNTKIKRISVKWDIRNSKNRSEWKRNPSTKSEILMDLGLHVLDYILYITEFRLDTFQLRVQRDLPDEDIEEVNLVGNFEETVIDVSLKRSHLVKSSEHKIEIEQDKARTIWRQIEPFTSASQNIIQLIDGQNRSIQFNRGDFINEDSRIAAYSRMLKSINGNMELRTPSYFLELKQKLLNAK